MKKILFITLNLFLINLSTAADFTNASYTISTDEPNAQATMIFTYTIQTASPGTIFYCYLPMGFSCANDAAENAVVQINGTVATVNSSSFVTQGRLISISLDDITLATSQAEITVEIVVTNPDGTQSPYNWPTSTGITIRTSDGGGNEIDTWPNPGPDPIIIQTLTTDNTFELANQISLQPNPASNKIWLSNNTSFSISKLTIYNQLGQKVYQTNTELNQVDTSYLNEGVYFLKGIIDNKSFIKQFIVKK